MNPARSFGPALAAGEWTDFWIYVVGPVLGAMLGAFAYQLVRGDAPAHRRGPVEASVLDAVAVITDIHGNLPASEACARAN